MAALLFATQVLSADRPDGRSARPFIGAATTAMSPASAQWFFNLA
jgi:hypothetical protein